MCDSDMVRRRGRRVASRTRTVFRNIKSRARRPKKNDMKRYAKKVAMGAAAGLLVSVPLTLAGRYFNQPMLAEVGQRTGSITSAHFGGALGNAGYQAADALFDRFVSQGGGIISGTQGQVYL